jgi:hypothetical protein
VTPKRSMSCTALILTKLSSHSINGVIISCTELYEDGTRKCKKLGKIMFNPVSADFTAWIETKRSTVQWISVQSTNSIKTDRNYGKKFIYVLKLTWTGRTTCYKRLIPRSTVLPENQPTPQPVKKFPIF